MLKLHSKSSIIKHCIDYLFSNLLVKRNSCFLLFKSNSIYFEKYRWGTNRHCARGKRAAS